MIYDGVDGLRVLHVHLDVKANFDSYLIISYVQVREQKAMLKASRIKPAPVEETKK